MSLLFCAIYQCGVRRLQNVDRQFVTLECVQMERVNVCQVGQVKLADTVSVELGKKQLQVNPFSVSHLC